MAAPYPKPDSERVNRHKPGEKGFEWTNLPARNDNPIPPMPEGIEYTDRAKRVWKELWESPQSTMWTGPLLRTVEKYISLYDRFFGCNGYVDTSAAVTNGMTQCEDRLGLSPKAMLQLRWRVLPEAAEADRKLASVEPISKPKRVDPRKAG